MTALVFLCAFEFIFVKAILSIAPALTIIWMKYVLAFVALLCIKLARKERWPFTVRDIPYFVVCGAIGELLYYFSSFNAINYLPVALVTVIIALCPVLSIILERIIFKKKIRFPTVFGICVSLFGICMVAGVDTAMLSSGRFWGYLLAFASVICANVYNILILRIVSRYSTFDISLNVIAAMAVICFPMAAGALPAPQAINTFFIVAIVFLGLGVGALGFLVYVNSLRVAGTTTTLMFSNFVPVVACVFGWLLLKETILPLQLVGGAITLAGCAAAIWFNDKQLEA